MLLLHHEFLMWDTIVGVWFALLGMGGLAVMRVREFIERRRKKRMGSNGSN